MALHGLSPCASPGQGSSSGCDRGRRRRRRVLLPSEPGEMKGMSVQHPYELLSHMLRKPSHLSPATAAASPGHSRAPVPPSPHGEAQTGCGSPKTLLGWWWWGGVSLKTSEFKPLAGGYFASGRSPQPRSPPHGCGSQKPKTRLQRRRGQASTSGKISSLPLLQSLSPAAEGANWNKYSVEILQYFPLARALSLFFWVVSTAVDSVSWFNYNKIYSIYCK